MIAITILIVLLVVMIIHDRKMLFRLPQRRRTRSAVQEAPVCQIPRNPEWPGQTFLDRHPEIRELKWVPIPVAGAAFAAYFILTVTRGI